MTRDSRPGMHDAADKDIHSKEGVAPYPAPNKTKVAGQGQGDLNDPADEDGDAPHDRGKAPDGGYVTGVDAMKNKLKREGEMENWKAGRTQEKPDTKH